MVARAPLGGAGWVGGVVGIQARVRRLEGGNGLFAVLHRTCRLPSRVHLQLPRQAAANMQPSMRLAPATRRQAGPGRTRADRPWRQGRGELLQGSFHPVDALLVHLVTRLGSRTAPCSGAEAPDQNPRRARTGGIGQKAAARPGGGGSGQRQPPAPLECAGRRAVRCRARSPRPAVGWHSRVQPRAAARVTAAPSPAEVPDAKRMLLSATRSPSSTAHGGVMVWRLHQWLRFEVHACALLHRRAGRLRRACRKWACSGCGAARSSGLEGAWTPHC